MTSYLIAALVCSSFASAGLVPTAPGPGEVFNAGSFCVIDWKPDTTSRWTNVTIDLMTGSNDNMTVVTTVVSSLDGSDPSLRPYNWTCPDVDTYSTIYFYQFNDLSDRSNVDTQWTTRFAIASQLGEFFPPQHTVQPNGDAVPWGTGHTRQAGGTHLASAMQPEDSIDAQRSHWGSRPSVTSAERTPPRPTGASKTRLPVAEIPSATLSLPPQLASAQSDVPSSTTDPSNDAVGRLPCTWIVGTWILFGMTWFALVW